MDYEEGTIVVLKVFGLVRQILPQKKEKLSSLHTALLDSLGQASLRPTVVYVSTTKELAFISRPDQM